MPEQPESRPAISTDAVIAICGAAIIVALIAGSVLVAIFGH